MKEKKVMVSGCYDLLHGGHIAFFKTAAAYGKLYVMLGQDLNLQHLKGKAPYFSQEERRFMVSSIKYVHEAIISSGHGMLDFEPEMRKIKPDIFIVNTDGHMPEKEKLCKELGVEYLVQTLYFRWMDRPALGLRGTFRLSCGCTAMAHN
jgi:cytidyltransferase-like protein